MLVTLMVVAGCASSSEEATTLDTKDELAYDATSNYQQSIKDVKSAIFNLVEDSADLNDQQKKCIDSAKMVLQLIHEGLSEAKNGMSDEDLDQGVAPKKGDIVTALKHRKRTQRAVEYLDDFLSNEGKSCDNCGRTIELIAASHDPRRWSGLSRVLGWISKELNESYRDDDEFKDYPQLFARFSSYFRPISPTAR